MEVVNDDRLALTGCTCRLPVTPPGGEQARLIEGRGFVFLSRSDIGGRHSSGDRRSCGGWGGGGMSEEASRHNPHRGLRPEMEEPVSRLTGFHVRLLAPLDDVY